MVTYQILIWQDLISSSVLDQCLICVILDSLGERLTIIANCYFTILGGCTTTSDMGFLPGHRKEEILLENTTQLC